MRTSAAAVVVVAFSLLTTPVMHAADPLAVGQAMPSQDEIRELASKADQQVLGFETAVKQAASWLDKTGDKVSAGYLNAASNGHLLIKALQQNSPSAYALVSLLATLDDLSLDAANANVQLVGAFIATPSDGGILPAVQMLDRAGKACNDIAELLLHATLRLIKIEEDLLQKLLDKK